MNKHEGHTVTYCEEGVTHYGFTVNENGDIVANAGPYDVDLEDSFLFCHDCMERVNGRAIGASDEWEIV